MPRWSNADRTPLAVLRSNAGLTRNQAAVKLDIALNTLGRYETGQGEVPLDIAEDMSRLYEAPFDDIRAACAAVRKPKKRQPFNPKEAERSKEGEILGEGLCEQQGQEGL